MAENTWNGFFVDQPVADFAAVIESDATNSVQDEHTVSETDTEDQVSAAPSIYTLTSSLRDQSFRQMRKRHIGWVLAPTSERQRRVADLGCGPGKWTLQCAADFPHVDVLGIDLAPTFTILIFFSTPPSNCHFEIDDLNLGLEHFFGPTFDLIHAPNAYSPTLVSSLIHKGMINLGIKDYAGLVGQISHCLRPGGMAIFVESDYRIRAEDKRILIPPNFYTPLPTKVRPPLGNMSSGSAGSRGMRIPTVLTSWAVPTWLATLTKCIRAKGGDIDSATLLKTWMMEHPNYVDVQALEHLAPLAPWKATTPNNWTEHPNFKIVGEMSRDIFIGLMKGARPLLYEWFSEAEVSKLEGDALRELESAVNPIYGCAQDLK
ncbi:hypothetical protein BDV93DRAFT_544706 [Ceratobasidium sp. AG-I]|nr:hypothetical protein BDV93DRAFT_544706 [Ceratobasidium sp. AG-I]